MRHIRVFIFLLVSIVVPLQGYAHVALPAAHCPMEQSTVMGSAGDAAHDCCHDAEDAAPAGKACKSGQPCHCLGQLFPLSLPGVLLQEALPAVQYPRVAGFKPSFDPAATWRPPAPL
jgi:hypothetical protein